MSAKPSKIFPNFYVGSYDNAKDEDLIMDMEITHILSVGTGMCTRGPKLVKCLISILVSWLNIPFSTQKRSNRSFFCHFSSAAVWAHFLPEWNKRLAITPFLHDVCYTVT